MQLWVRFLDAAGPQERLAGYQTLANLNPADATTLSILAQLNAENGDALLAIQDLERLRRYHSEPSLDLSLTLGWLLYSVGRKSDAEVEARLASLLDPDGPDIKELFAAIEAS
jgi:Flp pilus assembly protein TadD